MLVVPAVEIYVKRHNAARGHAGDQSPEGATKHGIPILEDYEIYYSLCNVSVF